jgi:hypothetical protein
MGLYPHESRRKRLETAGTAALLYLTVIGLVAAAIYATRGNWHWGDLRGFAELAIVGVVGLFGLIVYVRGGRR